MNAKINIKKHAKVSIQTNHEAFTIIFLSEQSGLNKL